MTAHALLGNPVPTLLADAASAVDLVYLASGLPLDPEAIVDALVALIAYFRSEPQSQPAGRIVVAVMLPNGRAQDSEALIDGVRGIVQAVTRERTPASAAINVVVVPHGQVNEAARALAFLSDSAGGFIAGATIDFRGSGVGP